MDPSVSGFFPSTCTVCPVAHQVAVEGKVTPHNTCLPSASQEREYLLSHRQNAGQQGEWQSSESGLMSPLRPMRPMSLLSALVIHDIYLDVGKRLRKPLTEDLDHA